MTNYRNTTVIRLNGINDPNLIERDDQYQMGTITTEVGAKVRIMWDGTNTPEYAFKSMLAKWENGTFLYTPVNSDKEQELREISELLKPVNSDNLPFKDMRDETDEELNGDNPHASVEMLEAALSAGEQQEADLNDNSDNTDEDYNDLNKGMTALSARLGTLLTTPDISDKPVKAPAKPRTRRTVK